jgi:hypothetical protein
MPDFVRFQGSYRYASPAALERAILAARAELDDDEINDPCFGSLRWFVKDSPSSVRVDVLVPAVSEAGFAVSHAFQALARDAVEGVVEARRGARRVDLFASGDDD